MSDPAVSFRTRLAPGDVDTIVRMHGALYAAEQGFDRTFEDYVAGPLAAFAARSDPRERIWIAELEGRIVGCVALVEAAPGTGQLRWFLVDPAARGRGLGTRLIESLIAFARETGYRSIVLWTIRALAPAARLYLAAGFRKTESHPGSQWGVDVIEEKYEIDLADKPGSF
jgi:GNAT superfamily N-acetyltransferase